MKLSRIGFLAAIFGGGSAAQEISTVPTLPIDESRWCPTCRAWEHPEVNSETLAFDANGNFVSSTTWVPVFCENCRAGYRIRSSKVFEDRAAPVTGTTEVRTKRG